MLYGRESDERVDHAGVRLRHGRRGDRREPVGKADGADDGLGDGKRGREGGAAGGGEGEERSEAHAVDVAARTVAW